MSMDRSAIETRRTFFLAQPGALILYAFASTLFVSAMLLFSVQPMFAKMVLPKLGGSPSVWAVAMTFFQAMLLIGYCYAHLLTRFAPARWAVVIHLTVCAGAFIFLPLALPAGWEQAPADYAQLWLLGLLAVSVGWPFLAVSATAPCCRPGSAAPATAMRTIPISSMAQATSVRWPPCSAIPSSSKPVSGCPPSPAYGQPASCCW